MPTAAILWKTQKCLSINYITSILSRSSSENISRSVMSNSLRPHGMYPPGSSVMGLSRQEYWNGLPFLSLWDLPDPGIEPVSPASPALQADSLSLSLAKSAQ